MAEVWDNVTGDRYWQDDDTGEITFAPEAGMLALAGRQFADLGAYDLVGANQNPSFPEVRQENLQARNAAFRGADMADPIRDIVGQALPGMATAPLSAGSLAGSLALNAGLGAAESGLDVGEGGTLLQRSLAGGLAGVAGDVGGRLVSRVARGVKGFLDDAAAGIMGRKAADNPLAQILAQPLSLRQGQIQGAAEGVGQSLAGYFCGVNAAIAQKFATNGGVEGNCG